MNDYDIKYLMDKYILHDKYDSHYELDAIRDIIHCRQVETRDPDEELIRQNNYLEERNSELYTRIDELKSQLETTKADKNSAQRKLKLFIKAAARLKFVDKLKVEIVKLVEAEKANIKFNKFFGITTNQLEEYENELEDIK